MKTEGSKPYKVDVLHLLPSRHFEHVKELKFSSFYFLYFAFLGCQRYHLYGGSKQSFQRKLFPV